MSRVRAAWHGGPTGMARRHAALVALLAGRRLRERAPWPARLLELGAAGNFIATYLRGRQRGAAEMEVHRARMGRLRPEVLEHFYVHVVGSMEAELEHFPTYDRRKHEQRYYLVVKAVIRHLPAGGVLADVGSASGLVLDRVSARVPCRTVGFDLSIYGLRARRARPGTPVLAQAVVEHIPMRDASADVVVFSEVIEHLVDAAAGMAEVARITRPGGVVVLTTNNAGEMPTRSPGHDPLQWCERLLGRWFPALMAFRNLTWDEPINDPADPLSREAPTYAPHRHFTYAELRDLAHQCGLEVELSRSFEFPAPQSTAAVWLRTLTDRHPALGDALAGGFEWAAGRVPGLRLMGTHHLLVLRRADAR
ncbi:MAG: class I SAM-dependent methyltransferase [Candidatus Dormibacteria bacterium]